MGNNLRGNHRILQYVGGIRFGTSPVSYTHLEAGGVRLCIHAGCPVLPEYGIAGQGLHLSLIHIFETPWNQKQPDGTYHAYAGDDIEAFLKKELSNRTPTEELVPSLFETFLTFRISVFPSVISKR